MSTRRASSALRSSNQRTGSIYAKFGKGHFKTPAPAKLELAVVTGDARTGGRAHNARALQQVGRNACADLVAVATVPTTQERGRACVDDEVALRRSSKDRVAGEGGVVASEKPLASSTRARGNAVVHTSVAGTCQIEMSCCSLTSEHYQTPRELANSAARAPSARPHA
eukprot:5988764-Pleurochrysis_carterae.AAC.3